MSIGLAAAPALAACDDPPAGGRRGRWAFWHSPEGQPAWARPALLGIAALAAPLSGWNITSAGLAPFYSVAVKSMPESWKAFFCGAFDPQATITIDKLAGSFLPQAGSGPARWYRRRITAVPPRLPGLAVRGPPVPRRARPDWPGGRASPASLPSRASRSIAAAAPDRPRIQSGLGLPKYVRNR